MSYSTRAGVILQRIHTLAGISEDTHGITRTFGSPAFMAGCMLAAQWMHEAGLEVRIDAMKNVRGRWACSDPTAPTMVLASHIDSVINAGAFDGPLGVLAAIDIVTQLITSEKALPFHIEVIAFSDEEGVRFHTTYLGSKTVTGAFDQALFDKRDADGISLREVIGEVDLSSEVIHQWMGYYEIHIEQGPLLYERNIPVAVVSAIAGQQRSRITIRGLAGHAGTVPMEQRQDALCGASEFILAVEKWAKEKQVVATVGQLNIPHAASNVIPGEVVLTLDIRSADEKILQLAQQELENIFTARRLTFEWEIIQQTAPVNCDAKLSALLERSVKESGYETIHLVSGAGHDAVPVSAVSPVCMLFVKCDQGISHHPQENVLLEDIAAALTVSDQFMRYLIKSL